MNGEEKKLKAHLMRRAGFGATANELDQLDNLTYDAVSYTHLTLPTKA